MRTISERSPLPSYAVRLAEAGLDLLSSYLRFG